MGGFSYKCNETFQLLDGNILEFIVAHGSAVSQLYCSDKQYLESKLGILIILKIFPISATVILKLPGL